MTKNKDNKDSIIKKYEQILLENKTPQHVINHCRAVTDVAAKLASGLNEAGFSLDEDIIITAAMLHDIKRTEKDHATVGAKLLQKYELDPKILDIVAVHMTYNFHTLSDGIDETDVVCLADRMVKEDKYVGFEDRMQDILNRFKDNKDAVKKITEKMQTTKQLLGQLEKKMGKSINSIIQGHEMSLDTILKKVEKPGRYIGGEINSVNKHLKDIRTRFAFAFPDVYEIGMSYTGLEIIYGLLNREDSVFCERVFAPASDMEDIMREYDLPLFTLETQTDIKKMNILGFTLQYELSYTNIINMMDLAGIPVLSKDRDDGWPLVVAGGPCAFNPEPLADVFDIVLLGDGEESLVELCHMYENAQNEGLTKKDFLEKVAVELKGAYVPSLYEPEYDRNGVFSGFKRLYDKAPTQVAKRMLKDLNAGFFSGRPMVPLIDTVHNRAVMEIFRGCGRGCRFCQAGMIYRPVRERSLENIKDCIYAELDNTGYDEVSLLSLSSGDYSHIEELVSQLMDELKDKDVSLSLPSMRLDSLNPKVLRKIGEYRKSSLTFAPEAGTQRLRNVINKNISEEDIMNMVEKAIELSWNKVKFYFMIGLPTETYEDLDGLCDLIDRVMKYARSFQEKGKRNFNVNVSVSNFVPKPNTPFQWCKGNTEKELLDKNYYLKDRIKRIKGASFQYHDTRPSHIEMLLAKGDRRTLDVIIKAVERGCKFDSWREFFKYDQWLAAFEDASISTDTDIYTDIDAPLPWDIIDSGVSKDFLKREYKKAMAAETTPDCKLVCSACGLNCLSADEYDDQTSDSHRADVDDHAPDSHKAYIDDHTSRIL